MDFFGKFKVPMFDVPSEVVKPFTLVSPITGLVGINLSSQDEPLFKLLIANTMLAFLISLYIQCLDTVLRFNATVLPKIPGVGPILARVNAKLPGLFSKCHATARTVYLLAMTIFYAFCVFLMAKGVATEVKPTGVALFNGKGHHSAKSVNESSEIFAWLTAFSFFMDGAFDGLLSGSGSVQGFGSSQVVRCFSILSFSAAHKAQAEYMWLFCLLFGSFRCCDFACRFNASLRDARLTRDNLIGENALFNAIPAIPKVADFKAEMERVRDKVLTALMIFMIAHNAANPWQFADGAKKNAWCMVFTVLFLRTAPKCPWMAKELFGMSGPAPGSPSPMKKRM